MLIYWIVFIFYQSSKKGVASFEATWEVSKVVEQMFLFSNHIKIPISLYLLIRKSAHVGVYFMLSIFWYLVLKEARRKRVAIGATGYSCLISILDETIQYITPGRHGLITDLGIDAMGILLGIVLIHVYCRKKTSKDYPLDVEILFC